jgi:hypothetical protein
MKRRCGQVGFVSRVSGTPRTNPKRKRGRRPIGLAGSSRGLCPHLACASGWYEKTPSASTVISEWLAESGGKHSCSKSSTVRKFLKKVGIATRPPRTMGQMPTGGSTDGARIDER